MARPKLGESDTERLHVKITADEVTAIDDFRYANRIPSRSEAVRRLCEIGLSLDGAARGIVDALEEVEMRCQGKDVLEPLYRALAPIIFNRLGIHKMGDLHLEVSESPVMKALYEAYNADEIERTSK